MKLTLSPPEYLNEQGQKRPYSEDYIYPKPGDATPQDRLFLVCDGVGGAARGDLASKTVCETFASFILQMKEKGQLIDGDYTEARQKDILNQALKYTETTLDNIVRENPSFHGMATTLTYLDLSEYGAVIAWAGDSRVYHLRAGKVLYKTEDHSLVNQLVKAGQISLEEAENHPRKNVILRAVSGSENPTKVDVKVIPPREIEEGDIFFMCTDGILDGVPEEQLIALLNSGLPLPKIKKKLLDQSMEFSNDNFSMYLIQVQSVEVSTFEVKSPETYTARGAIATTIVPIIEPITEPDTEESTAKTKSLTGDQEPEDGGGLSLWKIILLGVLGAVVLVVGIWFLLPYFQGEEDVKNRMLRLRQKYEREYQSLNTYYDQLVYLDNISKAYSTDSILKKAPTDFKMRIDSVFSGWKQERDKIASLKKDLQDRLTASYKAYKSNLARLDSLKGLSKPDVENIKQFDENLQARKVELLQSCAKLNNPSFGPCNELNRPANRHPSQQQSDVGSQNTITSSENELESGNVSNEVDETEPPWNKFAEIEYVGNDRYKVRLPGLENWGLYYKTGKAIYEPDQARYSFREIFPYKNRIAKVVRGDQQMYFRDNDFLGGVAKGYKEVEDYFGDTCEGYGRVVTKDDEVKFIRVEEGKLKEYATKPCE